jgi:hypothetical protein
MPPSATAAHANRCIRVLLAGLFVAICAAVAFPQSAGDAHVLSVIRERLGNPTRVIGVF